MGSLERSKKNMQMWKKAILHFCLCFVLGFFTGFAPSAKSSMFSNNIIISHPLDSSSEPLIIMQQSKMKTETLAPMPTKSNDDAKVSEQKERRDIKVIIPRRLVLIVTPTSTKDKLRRILLEKMANTLKLVSPPLLWVVVEQQSESNEVSELLRKTGIMYRHLVFKENITDVNDEMDHQRNVALNHIEHHKLSGIVHFAALSNVYDLGFFQEIRGVEVFGRWGMALLSANRKRVVLEGVISVSDSKSQKNLTPIHISSFAFNSSILWDPERWGRRTSSLQDTSQDSLKFVRKEVLQEETKLKGVPSEICSKILLWNLDISKRISSHV